MYQIFFRGILAIVRISCDSSLNTALGTVFAPQRGAAIGNQISPVRASISVAFLEQTWYNQYEHFLSQVSNKFLCLRYVDSRIILIDKSLTSHPAFQHFLHNDFYVPPVQLEVVDTQGFNVNFWDLMFSFIRYSQWR